MNEVAIDRNQIIGEVKERNRFYRALTRIQEITKAASNKQVPIPEIDEIGNVCREVLRHDPTR